MFIQSKDIGTQVYEILVEAVEREFQGESEADRQEAIAKILSSVVIL